MIRNLSQNTIEKMRAKRLAEYERLNGVVLSALRRLGGSFSGRVMVFRKELSESLREAQIKEMDSQISKERNAGLYAPDNTVFGLQ